MGMSEQSDPKEDQSVVCHEIGHMVDEMCSFSFSKEGAAVLAQYSAEEIAQGLSRYATASPQECVAEAIAEVFSNPSPRKISAEIYEKIRETNITSE